MKISNILILLSIGTLMACGQLDQQVNGTQQGKVEGQVSQVDDSSFSMVTNAGDELTVNVSEDTKGNDDSGNGAQLTDLAVGDNVTVHGPVNHETGEVDAIKIDLDNDSANDKEAIMVVGAGLGAPTVELDTQDLQLADSHIEVEGLVSSIAGNAIVVDIKQIEHSSASLGTQITVMLSDDFIKLGAISEIAVGDKIEIKGKLDDSNNFKIQLMKIEQPGNSSSDDSASDDSDSDSNSSATSDSQDSSNDSASDDSDDDSSNSASDDSSDDDSSIEVKAVVVSLEGDVLKVSAKSSDDIQITAGDDIVVDTTNMSISGGDKSDLAADVIVELKGTLDDQGNFVINAIRIENEHTEGSNATHTLVQEIKGTVTSVDSDAIAVKVSQAMNLPNVTIDSEVSIDIDSNTVYDSGINPAVGDSVEIKVNYDENTGFLAIMIDVQS